MTQKEINELEIDNYRYKFEGVINNLRLTVTERDTLLDAFKDLEYLADKLNKQL